jgi:hypothetical protein
LNLDGYLKENFTMSEISVEKKYLRGDTTYNQLRYLHNDSPHYFQLCTPFEQTIEGGYTTCGESRLTTLPNGQAIDAWRQQVLAVSPPSKPTLRKIMP